MQLRNLRQKIVDNNKNIRKMTIKMRKHCDERVSILTFEINI